MSYVWYLFALLLGYVCGTLSVYAGQWFIRQRRGTTRLQAYYPPVRRECGHIVPRVVRKGDVTQEYPDVP